MALPIPINLQPNFNSDDGIFMYPDPKFYWECAYGGQEVDPTTFHQEICIDNIPSFNSPIFVGWVSPGDNSSFDSTWGGWPGITSDELYYWRVRVVKERGGEIGDWSQTATFICTTGVTLNPHSPINGLNLPQGNVTFSWGHAIGYTLMNVRYRVQVDNNYNFSSVLHDVITPGEINYQVINITTPGVLYWRVRVQNPIVGDWSNTFNFFIVPAS